MRDFGECEIYRLFAVFSCGLSLFEQNDENIRGEVAGVCTNQPPLVCLAPRRQNAPTRCRFN